MKHIKYLTLISLLFFSYACLAQDLTIGIKYGIGVSDYKKVSDNEKISGQELQAVGLSLEYSPYYSRFFIIFGANYEMAKMGNYLSIPLDFRVTLGNNLRMFGQFGGYYSINILDDTDDYTLNNHYGLRAGAGILWLINKRLRLEGCYNYRHSLVSALDEEVLLPLNQVQTDEYKINSGIFEFAFKYRF
ncbi:MAG: outer membrane beta-barrel protein [Bacteroidales bacterium]|nr:outer membrane beta-barrel protein [Bacteroidales bacterium]